MKNLGIVIVAIGIIMSVFTGFNIITEKRVVDIGPVKINKTEKTPYYWSPGTGLVLISIGGVVLLAIRKKIF